MTAARVYPNDPAALVQLRAMGYDAREISLKEIEPDSGLLLQDELEAYFRESKNSLSNPLDKDE